MKKEKEVKSFIDLNYKPKKTDLICQYKLKPARGQPLKKVLNAIAGESSIGTWTKVSTMSSKIWKTLHPHIFYINKKNKRVRIAYPLKLFELGNLPEILSRDRKSVV